MTPDTAYLLDSLLVLLLPGFFALKIWEVLYPRIPSQKQDTFDKIATYFSLTTITYFFSLPIIKMLVGEPSSNIYLSALIAIITACFLATLFSFIAFHFKSHSMFQNIRDKLENYLPQKGPLWHKVFQIERNNLESIEKDRVFVKVGVFMKNETRYSGELDSYPIEDNIEDTKDFIIKGITVIRPDGEKFKYNPNIRMLLNQRDVNAIIFQYVTSKRIKEDKDLS